MTIDDFLQLITSILFNQHLIVKFLLAFFLGIYILYALIFFIQVRVLNRTVRQVGVSPVLEFITFGHLLAAIALLIFVVTIA